MFRVWSLGFRVYFEKRGPLVGSGILGVYVWIVRSIRVSYGKV